jgi:hypothetical protein
MDVNELSRIQDVRVMLTSTLRLPSTARLAMSLRRSGCTVLATTPLGHPLRLTNAASSILSYPVLSPTTGLEAIFRKTSPDLVIPCDERAVRHLYQLHRASTCMATRALIERSLGDPSNYWISEVRYDLLMAAQEVGVAIPTTRPLAGLPDLRAWGADVPLPWVLKADGSYAGQGVRIVSSREDAESLFLALNRPVSAREAFSKTVIDRDPFSLKPWLARSRPAISVQSYVDGRPANCSVACWEGEVLAAITMEVVVAESETGPSVIGRVTNNAQMLDAARRVARRLGLSGLAGFDFMIEATSGDAKLIEMNPRSTPVCHLNLGANGDLVEALTAKLANRVPQRRPCTTSMDVIALFPDALQSNPDSTLLNSAYHDIPWGEPALIRALLKPELRDRYWLLRQIRQRKGRLSGPRAKSLPLAAGTPAPTLATVAELEDYGGYLTK